MRSSFIIITVFINLFLIHIPAVSQNTVGLLSAIPGKSAPGFNLIYPHNQPGVFLLDACGRIVHSWPDSAQYRPGNTAYILENGNLLKTKRLFNAPVTDPVWAGGGGHIAEMRDWENNLLWTFELNNDKYRLHHDIEPMPNGNVLMIAWEVKTAEEAIEAGRNPELLLQDELWPDYILELDPSSMEIVWEWHVWDHLIQDFDPSKHNFGTVADHPELVNINYQTNDGHPDWMHANAIDYHPELDQVLISVPMFSEVWVIDHSTTTEEAAGHAGGLSGKGGDLLYRWGNPAAFEQGNEEDQKLFFQHDIHWVYGPGMSTEYRGKIALFNNRVHPDYSSVHVLSPAFDTLTWSYPMEGQLWGPENFERTVLHPDTFPMQSGGLSSVQVLPNDNLLICVGRHGYHFEISPENEIVWEYRTPFRSGQPVAQGTELDRNDNLTFRIKRYAEDYPGFDQRDLSPIGYIELDPNTSFCPFTVSVVEYADNKAAAVYPNPAYQSLHIQCFDHLPEMDHITVYDLAGRLMHRFQCPGQDNMVSVANWEPGIYFVSLHGKAPVKVIIGRP